MKKENIPTYDVIIVGGGPAGSTCASVLVKHGIHTILLDRANFPRVKLCAGWLSSPIWDILQLHPEKYPLGCWKWNKTRIYFRGKKFTLQSKGYFIRRYEFDNFLLRRSNVETREGYNVQRIERDPDGYWLINKQIRSKYLIGAGGSHCPVARSLFPKPEKHQCGTLEKEFEGNREEIAVCRAGEDGEPEILLHDDLKGYSWNVPKSQWLNIGTGTKEARKVKENWETAKAFFGDQGASGTIPVSSLSNLDKMKGHGYITFSTKHLSFCYSNNAFLVGDALGLAHPITGEGILPAVLSGKLCATAIINDLPESYEKELRIDSIFSDYQILDSILALASKYPKSKNEKPGRNSWVPSKFIVSVFAALFSGKPIPGGGLISKIRNLKYH